VWLVLAGMLAVVVGNIYVPTAMERYLEASLPPSCGEVDFSGDGTVGPAANADVELCFVHAVRTCTPRTLSYVYQGLDTTEGFRFQVERSSGACRVVDRYPSREYVVVPYFAELDCTGAPWDGRGWVLNCGPHADVQLWWPRSSTLRPVRLIPDPANDVDDIVNFNTKCLSQEDVGTVIDVCDGTQRQDWKAVNAPGGFLIRNDLTGDCLSPTNKSDGAQVIQQKCDFSGGTLLQLWTLWPVTSNGITFDELANEGDDLFVMHPSGCGAANDLAIFMHPSQCTADGWQLPSS